MYEFIIEFWQWEQRHLHSFPEIFSSNVENKPCEAHSHDMFSDLNEFDTNSLEFDLKISCSTITSPLARRGLRIQRPKPYDILISRGTLSPILSPRPRV
jgi:hypothetical protein